MGYVEAFFFVAALNGEIVGAFGGSGVGRDFYCKAVAVFCIANPRGVGLGAYIPVGSPTTHWTIGSGGNPILVRIHSNSFAFAFGFERLGVAGE